MASLEEGAFEAGMSLFAAMVAAEQRALERRERPARMLGAGTGREARIGGAASYFPVGALTHESIGLRVSSFRGLNLIMAGLVPAIHVFAYHNKIRGCPAQGRA
jgi:hypothetical protein